MGRTAEKKPPAPKEVRPNWMTSPGLVRFIEVLKRHGNATQALKESHLSRAWVYEKRTTDLEFAEAFDSARKCGLEVLKDEAWRRAHDGIDKPVFYQGKKVATLREYSDSLLMFLIKQHDPSYREHYLLEHANAGARPFMFQMMLHPDAVPPKP